MHVSFFEHYRNPVASTQEATWDQVCELLSRHEELADKSAGKLLNFCRFSTPYRNNENVVDVSALILDLDEWTDSRLAALVSKLDRLAYVLHTTHSHGETPDTWCARVVVRLDRPVPAEDWRAFARGIRTWLGAGLDKCVVAASQAYYLPVYAPGREHYASVHSGEALDVLAVLATQPVDYSAPCAPEDAPWRPEKIFTREDLQSLPGEVAARVHRGEPLAQEGDRHFARRDLVFQFLTTYGPGEPDGELLHLLTSSANAPREKWISEFRSGRARARAEAQNAANELANTQLAQANALTIATFDKARAAAEAAIEAEATHVKALAGEAFTVQMLRDIAKKAKPEVKAVLLAASGGNIPDDLDGAVSEAGRWLGFREAGRSAGVIKRALTHIEPAERCARLHAGIDLGQEQARNKEGWRKNLSTNDDKILGCESNLRILLLHHPDVAGQLVNDTRADKVRVGTVPWKREGLFWGSSDAGGAMSWATKVISTPVTSKQVEDALAGVRAALPQYDSAQAYLQNVPAWDHNPRLDTWLSDYAGCADSSYVRAVARACLIAAVARAMRPGCKVDQVPVFEGDQGIGKSTLIQALCPHPTLFTVADGALSLDNVRLLHKLQGAWIVELGELSSLSSAAHEAEKAFITNEIDSYRPPYGRHVLERPRRFVLFGTTNRRDYLNDATGNRRWLPLSCMFCRPAELTKVRDQLWAEAYAAFVAGEQWWVEPTAEVEEIQASRVQIDPMQGDILSCAEHFGEVSYKQIAAYLGLPAGHSLAYRLRRVLQHAGYVQGKRKRVTVTIPIENDFKVGTSKELNEYFWSKT